MLFNSLTFIVFFVVVFAVYWALPHKFRSIALLVSSYVFYGCWNPAYLILLFGLTTTTYFFSLAISRIGHHRKAMLVFSILVSFGSLVYFKYLDLFGQSANGLFALLGIPVFVPTFNILLPIGISFQTFQNVGYLIDVYRGTIPPEKNFLRYALFISYFPQLVAGPIERASNLLPQLAQEHTFSYSQTALGLRMMLVGFFKKIAVADTVAIYVDAVYGDLGGGFSSCALIVATVLFAFQIYCDFSGYSDIAIGASKVFGIDLMTNFRSPYCSRNPQEFWRRWHISLSTWFQDYLYIPLGGSRVKVPRYVLNLLITFTVSGLWHGASWTFVVWGAYHGILVSSYVLVRKFRERHAGVEKKESSRFVSGARTLFSVVATFVLVDIGWIFFRADSFSDAWFVVSHLFVDFSLDPAYIVSQLSLMGFDKESLILVVVLLVFLVAVDTVNYRRPIAEVIGRQKTAVRWGIYLAVSAVVVLCFMFTAQSQNFIYFQF